MMSVVLAYFGGRTTEKATSLFKKWRKPVTILIH
jgi:hypothetical protein